MGPPSDDERDWLADQLGETQRLISILRTHPDTPKRQAALEELARVQLRLMQALSAGEPPSEN